MRSREPARVVLGHVLYGEPGYPFMLALEIEYVLGPRGLMVSTSALNIGPEACPYGAGMHPYLSLGAPTIDGIMRQWHMNVARALRSPDGAFAGVILTDYRIDAISGAFSQARLGASVFLALVGTTDGRLRGAVGPAAIDPDLNIADTRRTIESWRIHYNTIRPHSSLGNQTPEQFRIAGDQGRGKDGRQATLENPSGLPLFPGHDDRNPHSFNGCNPG